MALERVAPVSLPRPVPGVGGWPPPAWRAGDLVLLRLVGLQDGVALLQGAGGHVWRLPATDVPLAHLPLGTALSWTVVSTRPQLALQLQATPPPFPQPIPAPGRADAPIDRPTAPVPDQPATSPASADLRPDAEILRLIHPLSGEATRLAFQWRHQVLTGSRSGERRERWRQRAADGALPWGLLATWLTQEDEDGTNPDSPPGGQKPLHYELWLGALRLGLLLVEPEAAPPRPSPRTHLLALRLMLSPPGWGPVVVQIEVGATGPGAEPGLHLRVAAAEPEALVRLQQQLPRLAGPITRLGLSLEGGRLEPLRAGMARWSPPAGRVQPTRLPPLLFRVAAELCLALWADETPAAAGPPAARGSAQ